MAKKQDYYETLGIKREASEVEIKKAYRKLARKFHPDINPGDKSAEDRFKEIQEAYDILRDKEKRQKYDTFGHSAFEQGFDPGRRSEETYRYGGGRRAPFTDFDNKSTGAEGFADLGDLFGNFFRTAGRGGQTPGPSQGQDLEYSLEIDFMLAALGGLTQILLQKESVCEACLGSGAKVGSRPQTCPACQGSGMAKIVQGPFNFSQPCNRCAGTGKVITDPCPNCLGRGQTVKSERVQVKIPSGVQDNSRIRLAGKGGPGQKGGPAGDLYIVLQVAKHPFFKREDDDIFLDVPISVSEAVLGTKVIIPTLDGKTTLTIPPGIQSGQKLRMRGLGVPHLKGDGRGDQYALIKIVAPKKLGSKARALMEEFARLETESPRVDTGW